MTDKPKTIMFFSNGVTAVFNAEGNQMLELQEPWAVIFAKFLESKGIDPVGINLKFQGSFESTEFFRTEEGALNWGRLRTGDVVS